MQRLFALLLAFALLAGAPAAWPDEGLKVVEAKLGKGIQNRDITEETTTFALNDRAYLWLRLTGGPAQDIMVSWTNGDQIEAVNLKVAGSPWRTWSSRQVSKAGAWKAVVTDAGGQVLKEITFTVQ